MQGDGAAQEREDMKKKCKSEVPEEVREEIKEFLKNSMKQIPLLMMLGGFPKTRKYLEGMTTAKQESGKEQEIRQVKER